MKILWLCSFVLPDIMKKAFPDHVDINLYGGGWLYQPASYLDEDLKNEFAVCAPVGFIEKDYVKTTWGNNSYLYGYNSNRYNIQKITKDVIDCFRRIIDDYKPDVVQINGAEFAHSLAMIRAVNNRQPIVLLIQGLTSICAKYHFFAGLKNKDIKRKSFRDIIRMDGIEAQRKAFIKRAIFEKQAIREVNHVLGRTDWDEACSKLYNPTVNYHYVPESIRKGFYGEKWDIDKCRKHRIFYGHSEMPLKGLHIMLDALTMLVDQFPDAELYVAGKNMLEDGIREKSYYRLIRKKINKLGLKEKVHFTGILDETGMIENYLNAHVFVLGSSIENESNTVDEAKILGVPVVASFVGGVTSRVTHEVDGFLFQHDAPYMLAYYIKKIFDSDVLAGEISKNAYEKQHSLCDADENYKKLLNVYKEIIAK